MTLGGFNLSFLLYWLLAFFVSELLSWKFGKKNETNTVSQLVELNQKRSRLFAWVILLLVINIAVTLLVHFDTFKYLF